MEQSGASEVEILRAEIDAAFEIIDTLPVDPHDMEVHFWCTRNCIEDEDEDDE